MSLRLPRTAADLGRRDFMALGAAAAAFPLAGGAQAATVAMPLSVGYWDGLIEGERWRAADALMTGDAAFRRRGLQLDVLGLSGALPAGVQAVNLVSRSTVAGLAAPVEVMHWGLRVQGATSVASASSQRLALDRDAHLDLLLEVRHADEATKRVYPLRLSSSWMPGARKLRRGTYALSFAAQEGAVDWSARRAWNQPESDLPRIADGVNDDPLPCLLIAVDYAA